MAGKKAESHEAPPVEGPGAGVLTIQERITAMMAHLLAVWTVFIGPLVIYVVRKNRSEFVAFHALQSVLFQLTVVVAILICLLLTLAWVGFEGLIPLVVIGDIIYVVSMGLKALDGDREEYIILGELARRIIEE